MNKIKRLVATMFNSRKTNKEQEFIFSGLKFTTNHTGKMEGMYSLSTSVLLNENCRERAKNPLTICSKCYAKKMTHNYKDLEKCLEQNTEILTSSIIPVEKLPYINAHSFRLEAFGDLINSNQVINYFNLCKKNSSVHFAIWTKNPFIISNAISKGYKKPANLIVIYSSPFIDKKVTLEEIQKHFPFVDKVFTVYSSEETAAANNATINCGSKKCIECLNCYRKTGNDEISELLK